MPYRNRFRLRPDRPLRSYADLLPYNGTAINNAPFKSCLVETDLSLKGIKGRKTKRLVHQQVLKFFKSENPFPRISNNQSLHRNPHTNTISHAHLIITKPKIPFSLPLCLRHVWSTNILLSKRSQELINFLDSKACSPRLLKNNCRVNR